MLMPILSETLPAMGGKTLPHTFSLQLLGAVRPAYRPRKGINSLTNLSSFGGDGGTTPYESEILVGGQDTVGDGAFEE